MGSLFSKLLLQYSPSWPNDPWRPHFLILIHWELNFHMNFGEGTDIYTIVLSNLTWLWAGNTLYNKVNQCLQPPETHWPSYWDCFNIVLGYLGQTHSWCLWRAGVLSDLQNEILAIHKQLMCGGHLHGQNTWIQKAKGGKTAATLTIIPSNSLNFCAPRAHNY